MLYPLYPYKIDFDIDIHININTTYPCISIYIHMNTVLNENIIIHILSFVVPPVYTIKSKYDPSENY